MRKILIDELEARTVLELLESAHVATNLVWIRNDCCEVLREALAEQPAQQEEPPPNKYNDKRIAWELERTAMGDGYYGNALYVAMDMPQATKADKEMLHRYMHGSNTKTDHVKLQDLAMRVYTTPQAQPAREPLTGEQIDKAAMKLAECMDYPWAQMPEQGKRSMRSHAKAVIDASGITKGNT